MTNPDRGELVKLEAERAELIAKNEAATSWGAAVGARSERIKGLDGRIAALRRLASFDSEVKVRELEWREPAGCFSATSHNSTGNYNIEDSGPNWSHDRYHLRLTFFGELGRFSTLEAAKAAAQRDYEVRILSALDM